MEISAGNVLKKTAELQSTFAKEYEQVMKSGNEQALDDIILLHRAAGILRQTIFKIEITIEYYLPNFN